MYNLLSGGNILALILFPSIIYIHWLRDCESEMTAEAKEKAEHNSYFLDL